MDHSDDFKYIVESIIFLPLEDLREKPNPLLDFCRKQSLSLGPGAETPFMVG